MLKFLGWFIVFCLACALIGVIADVIVAIIPFLVTLLFVGLIAFIAWKVYEAAYFKGEKFTATKERIQTYIKDCNELNSHIEDLRNTALIANTTSEGIAEFKDTSEWNMKRPALAKRRGEPNIHYCSRTVCDNASKAPFKYVCKYFGIKADEDTLAQFETILNNFEAAEEGKVSLKNERESILSSISTEVPFMIRKFSRKKLEEKLGFDAVDFNALYFPKYVFMYTSSGGNASTQCDVTMNIENLNQFVLYLSELVKFRKSAAGQRALMTSKLRQAIKERDGFSCKYCGASVAKEPNLLLEIDHIVPVSKGGLTTEDNLQTLCWRCNRSKGAKMQ
ncbi:MAG: HNH endonuclease [Oscillospiraceae bacterium]|nr:HNH endonuclease [Oscillospiraceae bacterium]